MKLSNRMHLMSVVAFATLVSALPACDDGVVLVRPPGSAPPTRVQAVIEVDANHPSGEHIVDFGEVYAGDTRTKELVIRNLGSDALQVQDLVLPDIGNFDVENDGEYDVILAPNASTVVVLSYSPNIDETLSEILEVASNDRETPVVEVTLRAEGLAPRIRIDPPSFDFGNRELGCVGQVDLTIANIGRAPLTLSSITYEDFAGSGELFLDHNIADGTELNPNEELEAVVFYSPEDTQPDSGQVVIESNDPSAPVTTATQIGLASLGESALDEYLQEGNNSTDILFVVDNSCSMGEEQSAMAVNFTSFLQIVGALDIDYHLGVATTDVFDNGYLQGTVPIITPNTPDPAGTFATNVNLGTSGSASEAGFQGAYLALSGSNIQPGGYNYGFLRDEAGLRIVFVSDEPDQSSSTMGWQTADYVSYFQGLKANPDHVVLSDVTGGLSGCNGGGGSADAGVQYVQATNMTGGVSAEICNPLWADTLADLAWLSQSFADTFELEYSPVEETIEVRLMTVPVFVGWIYDPALNAIVFDEEHVPENGDLIEIEYTIRGNCED